MVQLAVISRLFSELLKCFRDWVQPTKAENEVIGRLVNNLGCLIHPLIYSRPAVTTARIFSFQNLEMCCCSYPLRNYLRLVRYQEIPLIYYSKYNGSLRAWFYKWTNLTDFNAVLMFFVQLSTKLLLLQISDFHLELVPPSICVPAGCQSSMNIWHASLYQRIVRYFFLPDGKVRQFRTTDDDHWCILPANCIAQTCLPPPFWNWSSNLFVDDCSLLVAFSPFFLAYN